MIWIGGFHDGGSVSFDGLSVTSGINIPFITSYDIFYNFVGIFYKGGTLLEGYEEGVKRRWLAITYCLRSSICGIQPGDEFWYTLSCEGDYYHPVVGDCGSQAPILSWSVTSMDQGKQ